MPNMNMRDLYNRTHREARRNRWHGVASLHNPVRLTEGYPGLWVHADGSIVKLRVDWHRHSGFDMWEPR